MSAEDTKTTKMFYLSMEVIKILFQYIPGLAVLRMVNSLVSAAASALSFLLIQYIVDDIQILLTANGTIAQVIYHGGAFFTAQFLAVLCGGYVDTVLRMYMEQSMNEKLAGDILEKFRRIPYADYENPEFKNILQRMSKNPNKVLLRLFDNIIAVLRQDVTLGGILALFSQAGIGIAISFMVLFWPIVWLNFKSADKMNAIYNEQSMEQRKMEYLEQLLTEREPLLEQKIFESASYLEEKWKRLCRILLRQRIAGKVHAHYYYLVGNILTFLWLAAILFFLCVSVLKGGISLGVFVAVLAGTGETLDVSESLYMTLQQMRWQINTVFYYLEFMQLAEKKKEGDKKKKSAVLTQIRFENVSFAYPGCKTDVLHDVSFTINKGEHIALVGENGAGKSTIIKLLCRLYEPSSGRILINGNELHTYSECELRKFVAVVFQDYNRFQLSVRENIAAGALERLHEDADIRKALDMAGILHGEQLGRSLGKLDEEGIEVSMGQWQRIAIARAYFMDSQFVVLDEPTAAMDPVAENEVYYNISKTMKDRSCLFISHRMAGVKMADRIFVLSHGTIAEKGSHEELMRRKGIYANMYRMQSEWYQSDSGC